MSNAKMKLGSAGYVDNNMRDTTSIKKPEVQVVSNEKANPERHDATSKPVGASPLKALGKK